MFIFNKYLSVDIIEETNWINVIFVKNTLGRTQKITKLQYSPSIQKFPLQYFFLWWAHLNPLLLSPCWSGPAPTCEWTVKTRSSTVLSSYFRYYVFSCAFSCCLHCTWTKWVLKLLLPLTFQSCCIWTARGRCQVKFQYLHCLHLKNEFNDLLMITQFFLFKASLIFFTCTYLLCHFLFYLKWLPSLDLLGGPTSSSSWEQQSGKFQIFQYSPAF